MKQLMMMAVAAKDCGVCPQNLPAKYAMRLRLNHVRALLEETDDTVASIATDVGFYDQSHFVKAFRRIYRTSPDAYRKRHGASGRVKVRVIGVTRATRFRKCLP